MKIQLKILTLSMLDKIYSGFMEFPQREWGDIYDFYNMNKAEFAQYIQRKIDLGNGINLSENQTPQTTYILYVENKPVGFSLLRTENLTEFNKIHGNHLGYMIFPSERKKGYGKIIVQKSIKVAKKLGYKKILAQCDIKNIASAKCLESNGFVKVPLDNIYAKKINEIGCCLYEQTLNQMI